VCRFADSCGEFDVLREPESELRELETELRELETELRELETELHELETELRDVYADKPTESRFTRSGKKIPSRDQVTNSGEE
jgi:chromosome segregation ATPase